MTSDFKRRDVLRAGLGTAAAAAAAIAAQSATRAEAQERARRSTMNLGGQGEARRGADLDRRHNPVLFWNEVALQLVALDHSIDARDARAPGPCASARALALVHIVMADAVAAVYPVDFEGLLVQGRVELRQDRDVFVAGAAAWMLEHIFGTPAHSQLIGTQRLTFLDSHERSALAAWEAGLSFARNEAFTSRWDWPAIRRAVLSSPTPYVPRPRGHTVDPFNADQGFYGVGWGQMTPLDPRLGDPTGLGPGDPPGEEDRSFQRDFEEVRQVGVWRPEGPTDQQLRQGLFWAYDGARLIGTPPRLYNQIVRQIAEDDGMSVPELARCLALCNLAMADAGIVCWEAKYRYGIWRPVVAIRQSLRNRADWRPYGSPRTNPSQFALGRDTQLRATAQTFMGASESGVLPEPRSSTLDYKLAAFTPSFPAYPSGHASFGAACFAMLKRIRAERERTRANPNRLSGLLDLVSDELNGVSIDNFNNRPRPYMPLAYTSIDRMIEDNNRSRVYLGVHWHFDCERGAASGERVADRVYGDAYPRRSGFRPVSGGYRPEPSRYRPEEHQHAPRPVRREPR